MNPCETFENVEEERVEKEERVRGAGGGGAGGWRNQSFCGPGRVLSQGWNFQALTEERHQEWSLRLDLTRHRKPHQVET